MEIEKYQALAMRTSPPGHDRVLNGCLGLIGEVGEIVDIVKKWKFQSGDNAELPTDKIIDECGDVLWYCAELAEGLNDSIARMYALSAQEFDDMREFVEESPIEITVGRLASFAPAPFEQLEDMPPRTDEKWRQMRIASAKAQIVGIMVTIRDILEVHCKVTMSGAMDYNIAKLRKRYPDGFDPERSLHRNE